MCPTLHRRPMHFIKTTRKYLLPLLGLAAIYILGLIRRQCWKRTSQLARPAIYSESALSVSLCAQLHNGEALPEIDRKICAEGINVLLILRRTRLRRWHTIAHAVDQPCVDFPLVLPAYILCLWLWWCGRLARHRRRLLRRRQQSCAPRARTFPQMRCLCFWHISRSLRWLSAWPRPGPAGRQQPQRHCCRP